MPTSSEVNKLVSSIDNMLLKIGKTNGTLLPEAKTNTGGIAAQYWLWHRVAPLVKKMLEQATSNAIKAGIIFDHKKHPLDAGVDRQIYSDRVYSVRVATSRGHEKLDHELFVQMLRRRKVDEKIIEEATQHAMRATSPPHRFTVTMIEEPGTKAGYRE